MLVRRVAGTFSVRFAAAIGSLALAALVISSYSLEKFGQFAFALATVRIVAAFSLFSLDSFLLRMLIRFHNRGSSKLRIRLEAECSGLVGILSLSVAIAVAGIGWAGTRVSTDDSFWLSLIILSPYIVFHNTAALQVSRLRSENRDFAAQLVQVGLPSLLPVFCLAIVFGEATLPEFLPEILIVAAMATGVILGARQTTIWPFDGLLPGVQSVMRGRLRVLRYSSAIHSANMMNFISDWYGALILSATQSFEVFGVLRIFQQFGQAFQLLAVSIEVPFSTEMAKAHIAKTPKRLAKLLLQSQLVLGFAGLLSMLAIVLAFPLIDFIFEFDLAPYRTAFILYLVFMGLRLFSGASASALNIMDTTRQLIRASLIALICSVVLLSALTPFYGLIGAIIGVGSQHIVRALVVYAFVKSEINRMLRRHG